MSEQVRRAEYVAALEAEGDTGGSVTDWLREWQQVRASEPPCFSDGHDFAIAAPIVDQDGKRIYDLICHRCGEYREVRSP